MTADVNEIVIRKKKGEEIVTIRCPKCESYTKVGIDDLQMFAGGMRVQCGCNHTFNAKLEFRRGARKKANVEGFYCKLNELANWKPHIHSSEKQYVFNHNCRILDISMHGLSFEVIEKNSLKVGEKIRIRFKLITSAHNEIEKDAVIRSVVGNRVHPQNLWVVTGSGNQPSV